MGFTSAGLAEVIGIGGSAAAAAETGAVAADVAYTGWGA